MFTIFTPRTNERVIVAQRVCVLIGLSAVVLWISLGIVARAQGFDMRVTTYAGVGYVKIGNAVCGVGRFGGCYSSQSVPTGYTGDGAPATAANLGGPSDVAVDVAGNLYVAVPDYNRVRKITREGIISTIAGTGTAGCSGDGGQATSAQLNYPEGVTVDNSGNVFIADSRNQRVRKIDANGVISTVAGNGPNPTNPFSQPPSCPGTSTPIDYPEHLVADPAGNVFVCTVVTAAPNPIKVLKISTSGSLSTFAAVSSEIGMSPCGIALDSAGDIFYSTTSQIFKTTPDGQTSLVGGSGASVGSGDGEGGPATATTLGGTYGMVVDTAGSLLITTTSWVRKIGPDGIITTIVRGPGGMNGADGDFGPGEKAGFYGPISIALDSAGNLFVADRNSAHIWKIALAYTGPTPTTIPFSKSLLLTSTNAGPDISSGYGIVSSQGGTSGVSGLAIFGEHVGDTLVSEAGVPATPVVQSGRIYAEIGGAINTGVAIANPFDTAAQISFFFTDANGTNSSATVTTIAARSKLCAFLTEPPFNAPSPFAGTFTFSSSLPVGAIALRGRVNDRSEFLMTTLPVKDLADAPSSAAVVFPHYADGLGWLTQLVLTNPEDSTITGSVQFLDPQGMPAALKISGQTDSSFPYSIPPKSSRTWQTSGEADPIATGSIVVTPATGAAAPVGVSIFSFRINGVTVTEAGVPASSASTAFRVYAETQGSFPDIGSIQSGFAIANPSSSTVGVTVELDQLDGTSLGLTGSFAIPPGSQKALLLNQLPGFTSVPASFQGELRLKTTSGSVSIIGLRLRVNERGETLITTTPATDDSTPYPGVPLLFSHVVDSGGFTTQFILYGDTPFPTVSPFGLLELYDAKGGPLIVGLQ
jgi:hypothetical protein